jgi:riboflavin kinase/FMN adenylyltransferase
MDLYEGLDTIDRPFRETTVAIGTFDGVHRGHQSIISSAVSHARRNGQTALVFTFDRHPAELLAPDRAPAYITTPAQRNALIAGLGVDALVIAHFDSALSKMSPDSFVHDILKRLLGATAIVVGNNFRFGHDRSGDVQYLAEVQSVMGFELQALEPVMMDGVPISSTRVREAILAADMASAEEMLGHSYYFEGRVVHGRKLGRTLGYPTANLEPVYRQVAPPDGIYAVEVTLPGGKRFGGACSIGNRPTVDGAGHSIEVYLLDFDGDIYDAVVDMRFVRRLRDELKFDSLDALKRQIETDVVETRAALAAAQ